MASTVDPEPWLLATDEPSVRWKVLTELHGRRENDPEVAAARAEVGTKGWGAALLGTQLPEGTWVLPAASPAALYRPKYTATNWQLLILADLGAGRDVPGVERAAEIMFRTFGGANGVLTPGEDEEVCFAGNLVRMLASFGYGADPRLAPLVDWLVTHQKSDGGWHCFPSETGTLDCWEALAAFAALPRGKRTPSIRRSIERGAEFYLERGLLREGESEYAPWLRFHYPVHYYYDLLVGLDVLTRLGYGRDPRMVPALERLEARRHPDGTWDLDAWHPDVPVDQEDYRPQPPIFPVGLEYPGRPSRWITLTALSVLHRAGRDPAAAMRRRGLVADSPQRSR